MGGTVRRWTLRLAAVALPMVGSVEVLPAQTARADLPFGVGEELNYRVSMGRLGGIGQGTMRVEGPERVRGESAYLLSFDLRGRVAVAVIEDRTRSWIDPRRMASLRYHKRERNPLFSHAEQVEVFPGERRWEGADGAGGTSATDTPLDELSFLYHIRTLPLRDGDVYSCNLHFDQERNPVQVRVVKRGRTRVPAGEFATVLVEMRVNDNRRYGGNGVIRLYLTDDDSRIPVRIESSVPVAGSMTLSLESKVLGRVAGR